MIVRVAAVAVIAAGLAAVAVAALGGDSHDRTLRTAFTSAVNVVAGQEVRLHGVQVGEIESVEERDGLALVRLRIDDEHAWPLHHGTRARLRYGTTVSYAARYVELFPGARSAPALPSDGLLSTEETTTPVEFDDIFNVVDRKARADLRRLLGNGAATFRGRERELQAGLRDAGPAFAEAAELTRRLGDDPEALRTLAHTGAATTRALAEREESLRELVDGAAATFDELAGQSRQIAAGLERYPRTLRSARTTLARLDASLTPMDALVAELRPGARDLRAVARPLRRVVATLDELSPRLQSALRGSRTAAPAIRAFVREGGPFMERLAPVASKLAPIVGCIRPYAPEMAGFISTWAGFAKNHDAQDHYVRTLYASPPASNTELRTSAEFVAQTPGQQYAFPRVPGFNVGQPWLMERCGAGRDALDPTRDPESKPAGRGR